MAGQQFIRIIGVPAGAVAGPNASVETVVAVASTSDPTTTIQFEFGNLLGVSEVITEVMTVTFAAFPEVLSEDDSPLSVVQVNLSAPPTSLQGLCVVATNYDRTVAIASP
jgi:hypothetical protein